ncbi:hypothetical protein [Pseudomonas sp. BMS12]|uniref:hypothetical protein n=1 Tax=Pseudomonas sp. BMS12 TaxID=1796033 RepID=UPI0012903166|nr:hypothetical protein [Pseudomonas sp. BMS12]
MTQCTDHADAEVKGIARYIPTTLSKGILLLLPGTAWFAFSAIREHPSWFGFQNLTELEQTLTAALASAAACIMLVIVLVLDMAIAVHHSKHRRTVHYSNTHPLMSFKFLASNATVLHWLVLGLVCTSFFAAGYVVAKT